MRVFYYSLGLLTLPFPVHLSAPTQHFRISSQYEHEKSGSRSAQCTISVDSFGTQIEARVRVKLDISFFLQSQQIRADDGCSSWREAIRLSASVASAQLSLLFGTFCFSWDMQTWSQTIPLHHLEVPKLFGRLIKLFIIQL